MVMEENDIVFYIFCTFFDFDIFRSSKFFDHFVLQFYVRQKDNLSQNKLLLNITSNATEKRNVNSECPYLECPYLECPYLEYFKNTHPLNILLSYYMFLLFDCSSRSWLFSLGNTLNHHVGKMGSSWQK